MDKLKKEVEKILFSGRSKFQDVVVFRSKTYGNVLALDGVIQATERDEFSYSEMMAHLPLFSHRNPQHVLVVGGGDGGVVREVLKHKCVQSVTLCELDEMVIEKSKQFLPAMASSLSDARVTVEIMDGAVFMGQNEGRFDVIIVDSSDPVGPAEVLFEKPFYLTMKKALRPNGIVCTQGECMWLHRDLIANVLRFSLAGGYTHAQYAVMSIPSYPCGSIGMILCTLAQTSCAEPQREPDDAMSATLKYYSPQVHRAAFALPPFVQRAIAEEVAQEPEQKKIKAK